MEKFNSICNQFLKEQRYEDEEVFEKYLDKINFRNEHIHKLQDIIEILGYRQGFSEFLEDNPGAVEKIIEFISEWTYRNQEWREAIQDELDQMEEDSEEVRENFKDDDKKEHWFFTNSDTLEVHTAGSGNHPSKTYDFENIEDFENFIKKLKEEGYKFIKDQKNK